MKNMVGVKRRCREMDVITSRFYSVPLGCHGLKLYPPEFINLQKFHFIEDE